MKKILYVTTIGTSINTFLVPHILHLIKKGYTVDVATNVDVDIDIKLIEKGVNVFNIPFQRNPLSIKNKNAFKEIKRIQKKEKYNIVHVHTPVASFITRLALKDEKNLKIFYTCHGFHFYKGSSLMNWMLFYPLEKMAAKWTDKLITINTEDFKVAKKFNLRKDGTVHKIHGVGIDAENYIIDDFDKNVYRKKIGLKEDDFIILILAELNKNKNHIQIIKAMSLLREKHSNIKVVFAGKGPLEENLKIHIENYGLKDNIFLLGWRTDIKELINSSDLVALFSKREGLGKCLLEAMICKKCIIATNTRGPREIIDNNKNGILVGVNNIQETVNAINYIYEEINIRNKFIKESNNKIKKYLIENVLNELEGYY